MDVATAEIGSVIEVIANSVKAEVPEIDTFSYTDYAVKD
ncbi:MAG: hypothetical protein ACI9BF_000302 [Candidatus Paceibacteria bacterium]